MTENNDLRQEGKKGKIRNPHLFFPFRSPQAMRGKRGIIPIGLFPFPPSRIAAST
jgi:hypothetical protein